jgi:hypothetical protein
VSQTKTDTKEAVKPAVKFDQNKAPLAIIPGEPLFQVAWAVYKILSSNNPSTWPGTEQARLLLLNASLVQSYQWINRVDTIDGIDARAFAAANKLIAMELDYYARERKEEHPAFLAAFEQIKNLKLEHPPVVIVPHWAITQVALVLGFGATKYGMDNYKAGFEARRLASAPLRHQLQSISESPLDPESGIDHRAHAVCGDLMSLETSHLETLKDDRFIPQTKEKK